MNSYPVAIGGLGGSGTRIVAEMLAAGGVYIGEDLNDALDNQWFTLLMKRPKFYPNGDPRRPFTLFKNAMEGRGRSDPICLGRATCELFCYGTIMPVAGGAFGRSDGRSHS
jgi:hypothetical protein